MRGMRGTLFTMIIIGAPLMAVDCFTESPGELSEQLFMPHARVYRGGEERLPRSYEAGIDETQLDDLRYALHALAYNSFSAILADRVQLQEALMRVDEVHPLHFLSTIFTDRGLTDCMHVISDKQWLWRHFFTRFKRTMDEEIEKDNVRPEYIMDLADALQVEFEEIANLILECNWDALVTFLFDTFPSSEE